MSIDAGSRPVWVRIKRFALPAIIVTCALVHPLARLSARWDWRADLISHFRAPALATTLVAMALMARRHRLLAVALAALAAFQAMPLFDYWGANPVPPEPRSTARLRLLMSNVLVENFRFAEVAELIRRERPDIVGLVEVDPAWLMALTEVRREYPFHVELPYGAMGLALWFRERPLSIDPPKVLLPGGWPVLHVVVELDGLPRHLWLVHPASPLRRDHRTPGNPELAALAEAVAKTPGSTIVMGDLNCTEASPYFGDFLRETGLRDSRLGFGRQPSWPAGSPYMIAIDHAFVSRDLAVVGRRLGPEIGSDHLPLILDLAPAAGPIAARTSPSHSGAVAGSTSGAAEAP